MDRAIYRDLEALRPDRCNDELRPFLDLAPHLGTREVPDPYGQGPEGFERTLDLIGPGSEAFAASLARSLPR